MNLRSLTLALDGGETKRCHTLSVIHEENIAAHSFGVAWICCYLSDGIPRGALLLAALAHDLPEQYTGDIPADVKRSHPELKAILAGLENVWLAGAELDYHKELRPEETGILKLADSFHLMWKCVQERNLGNQTLGLVWRNVSEYAQRGILEWEVSFKRREAAHNLNTWLQEQWRQAHGIE